jgi:hypothetical protein
MLVTEGFPVSKSLGFEERLGPNRSRARRHLTETHLPGAVTCAERT